MQAGNSTPAYTLRYSSRARRVRLRVLPGKVVVTAPENTRKHLINLFVSSRAGWIREKLSAFDSVEAPSSEIEPENGSDIWVQGNRLVLRIVPEGGNPMIKEGSVFVGEKYLTRSNLREWLDSILLKKVQQKVQECSLILGVSPERIRLGNAVSRWGSCSPKGVIMINRKLAHAPAFVVDYIAAHEMAHLVHRNHSAGFHRELNGLGVEIRSAGKWLRLQGAFLIQ